MLKYRREISNIFGNITYTVISLVLGLHISIHSQVKVALRS